MLPEDLKDFRAPRWYDPILEAAPVIILCALILCFILDHYRVGA